MSEKDLFFEEMSGVKPLKREPRERLVKTADQGDVEFRREAAAALPNGAINSLLDEGVEPLDAWYVLDFKRPGIQHGVFKKLRMG